MRASIPSLYDVNEFDIQSVKERIPPQQLESNHGVRLIFHTLLLHSALVFVKYITTALTCVVLMVFEVVFKLFFRPHEDQIVFIIY